MDVIDGSEQMAWLISGRGDGMWSVGVEPDGFEARVKVFHAMWEHPSAGKAESYDQAEKRSIAEGEREPRIVGDTNLSEVGTLIGTVGGPSQRPSGWRRLRWSDLAQRWGVAIDADAVNSVACFSPGLKSGSWPTSILPPTEGSLDWESYERLMSILCSVPGPHSILAFSTILTWFGDTGFEVPLVYSTAEELLAEYQSSPLNGSGQNWWPEDRRWLVYTDYDLCTTTVHGDRDLIQMISSDDYLEAFELLPDPD